MKAGRVALLSLIIFVAGAAPAAAAPLLAAVKRPWHYWLSIVLSLSVVGLAGMLILGYLVRVVMAKYGIRVGRRSAG
ncbi:MAG: hypothetical protein ACRD0O_05180 [Acidimicrobiia bacterium]